MRKIIVAMSNSDSARRFMEKAKKTPGVRYVQRYMVGCHYHCMVTGDYTEEVKSELLGKKKNLAETTQRI